MKSRPPLVQVKHLQKNRTVATASQKLCLFKVFPFRKTWLPVLEYLCNMFYRTMLERFPEAITPKVHFIGEYEQIIHNYGPAIKQWCFRYEACHAYFKKITCSTNNFKNVPKMLITRHCLKQCFKFAHLCRLKTISYPVRLKQVRSTRLIRI